MPCFSSRSPIHQTLHCRRTLHVLPLIRSRKRPQDAALIDIVLDFIMISLQYQLSERNMPARTTQSAASERIASTMSGWGMLILNIALLFGGIYLISFTAAYARTNRGARGVMTKFGATMTGGDFHAP